MVKKIYPMVRMPSQVLAFCVGVFGVLNGLYGTIRNTDFRNRLRRWLGTFEMNSARRRREGDWHRFFVTIYAGLGVIFAMLVVMATLAQNSVDRDVDVAELHATIWRQIFFLPRAQRGPMAQALRHEQEHYDAMMQGTLGDVP